MATQVLPIADTKVSAEFTLSVPTLVWIHGTGALNAYVGIDAKGSDGVFSQVAELGSFHERPQGEELAHEGQRERV